MVLPREHAPAWEKGNNAEHRASSPLTLATVADAYGIGIGGCFDTQGTATAMRDSCHRTPPLVRCTETTRRLFLERPLTLGPACGSGADFEVLPEGVDAHPALAISRHGDHYRMLPGGSRNRCMKTRSSQRPNLCPTSLKWATRSNPSRS
jgi:hypothetical protein